MADLLVSSIHPTHSSRVRSRKRSTLCQAPHGSGWIGNGARSLVQACQPLAQQRKGDSSLALSSGEPSRVVMREDAVFLSLQLVGT
jgi:hypothetical protein